jgi:hypothetical protein
LSRWQFNEKKSVKATANLFPLLVKTAKRRKRFHFIFEDLAKVKRKRQKERKSSADERG